MPHILESSAIHSSNPQTLLRSVQIFNIDMKIQMLEIWWPANALTLDCMSTSHSAVKLVLKIQQYRQLKQHIGKERQLSRLAPTTACFQEAQLATNGHRMFHFTKSTILRLQNAVGRLNLQVILILQETLLWQMPALNKSKKRFTNRKGKTSSAMVRGVMLETHGMKNWLL